MQKQYHLTHCSDRKNLYLPPVLWFFNTILLQSRFSHTIRVSTDPISSACNYKEHHAVEEENSLIIGVTMKNIKKGISIGDLKNIVIGDTKKKISIK